MNKHRKTRGFTLIELMITVAIIGILAAIAYPTYISQIRQSRRTDAISLLMRAANRQERFYTTQYSYATSMTALGLPAQTDNGWYTLTVANPDANSFQLTASAQNDQLNDTCTSYGLNQLGEKTANGNPPSSSSSQECW